MLLVVAVVGVDAVVVDVVAAVVAAAVAAAAAIVAAVGTSVVIVGCAKPIGSKLLMAENTFQKVDSFFCASLFSFFCVCCYLP